MPHKIYKAILNINTLTRKLLIKPNVTARGFVMVNENQELMNKIETKISEIVSDYLAKSIYSYTDLKNQIIFELLPYINELTGRDYKLFNYYGDPEATDIIIAMAPAIPPTMKEGALFISSGIINFKENEVNEILQS